MSRGKAVERETGLWPYSPQLGIYGPRQPLIAVPNIPNPKQGREYRAFRFPSSWPFSFLISYGWFLWCHSAVEREFLLRPFPHLVG